MAPSRRQRAPRPSYHHGDARAALITEAIALIEADGVAQFSLREAARRVGIDPAAVYRHFRGREALLVAVAQRGFELLSARNAADIEALEVTATARDRLMALGFSYVRFAAESPDVFRLMFGGAGLGSRADAMRAGVTKPSPYDRLIEALGAWSAEAGLSIDTEAQAQLLWAAVHGVARLVIDGALALDTDKTVVALTDAILHAAAR